LESTPFVISALSHSAQLFRQTLMNGIGGSGVVGPEDLKVVQEAVANLSVNVEPGYVVIPGTQGSTAGQRANSGSQHTTYATLPASFTAQGVYDAVNPARANQTLEAANATNPRIDLICAIVQDTQYSGSFNQALLVVVAGTPAGSPAPPTPPENSVVLAQVKVAAKATKIEAANITDERPIASAGLSAVTTASVGPVGARTEFSSGAPHVASVTRPTLVVIQGSKLEGEGSIKMEVKVGGNTAGFANCPATTEAINVITTVLVPAGVAWEVPAGQVAKLHATYCPM
jgi:hypothetical protein